jgi:hypothetical protein
MVAVLSLTSISLTARSASVFDDFESYTPGSNLHGQGSWQGWDNDSSKGALVTTGTALSGSQGVTVGGNTDLVRIFGGVSGGCWVFSLWQYVPSSSDGTTYVILLNQYQDGGPCNWSVQIENNMTTGKVVSDLSLTGPSTVDLIKDRWVEYQFHVNLAANSVAEYYNGELLSTHPWQSGGLNRIQALDLYAEGSGPVYYDDVSLKQIPEPASLTLLGLGAALLAWQRRR